MRSTVAFAALCLALTGCGDSSVLAPYRNPKFTLERRVEDLIRRLSPQEKLAILANRGVDRLNIPALRGTPALAGLHTGGNGVHATAFPSEIAMAATWNPELVGKQGRVIAQEAQSLGYAQVFGPSLEIADHPLRAGAFETYGEDPWLASRMAVAWIGAVQGEGIIATPGDFHVRDDVRATREIYLSPYRAAVEESGVWSVRASIDSRELVEDLLKNQWGFNGFVTGLDLAAPGKATPAPQKVDDSLRRVLRILFITGFFDRIDPLEKKPVDTFEQRAVARAAAVQSIVLLKNTGNLLPLDVKKVRSIALIGPNAEINRLAGGSSAPVSPDYSWKPADGIRERTAGSLQVSYALGVPMEGESAPGAPEALLKAATDLAARSDVAIVFAGFSAALEGTSTARKSLSLPAGQDALIQAVARANRNTIVVINAGSPVALDPWLPQVPTVLQAWYPGQEGGHAIADVVFGDANPSGKLPVTFPRTIPEGIDGIFIGYKHFDQKGVQPLFPFGHGLSYTQFTYSDLTVTPVSPRYGQVVTVRLKVTNTGQRAGAEVVQLYVHDQKSSLPRPPQELKAFQRVELKPGQTKLVMLTLDRRSMWFYDPLVKDWAAEPGEFEIRIGSSSRDIRLRGSFTLYE
jgi:beta-glucosidase